MDHEGRWGWQAGTTVPGPLLKVDNLLGPHERGPRIDRIITWNSYMVNIDRAMGFEPLDEWNTRQFRL